VAGRPPICTCELQEFWGGTVCGVGAGSFASFPCQTDRVRKNNDRVGPTRLEIAVWQGRGAIFRAGNSQNKSKEVLGMAKWFSAKETMLAQRCQFREGESKTETASFPCQTDRVRKNS
jgi:hypothetical protein